MSDTLGLTHSWKPQRLPMNIWESGKEQDAILLICLSPKGFECAPMSSASVCPSPAQMHCGAKNLCCEHLGKRLFQEFAWVPWQWWLFSNPKQTIRATDDVYFMWHNTQGKYYLVALAFMSWQLWKCLCMTKSCRATFCRFVLFCVWREYLSFLWPSQTDPSRATSGQTEAICLQFYWCKFITSL